MQSCRFFSPDLFMRISNFSKTVHTTFIKFQRAPVCSKTTKLYDWIVRNIARFSPKMAKISRKTAIFRLFSIFSKTVHTIRRQFFYSHSTPYYGPLYAVSLNSYGWDVRNIAKINPKMAKKTAIFWTFFDFCKNCPYDSNETF